RRLRPGAEAVARLVLGDWSDGVELRTSLAADPDGAAALTARLAPGLQRAVAAVASGGPPPQTILVRQEAAALLRAAMRPGRPASDSWGWDRGRPIDRLYIEGFLREHAADIHGRVLEVKDDEYARAFGRELDRVDVLDVDPANPVATLVADLASTDAVPEGA